jgi:hypothetical protein
VRNIRIDIDAASRSVTDGVKVQPGQVVPINFGSKRLPESPEYDVKDRLEIYIDVNINRAKGDRPSEKKGDKNSDIKDDDSSSIKGAGPSKEVDQDQHHSRRSLMSSDRDSPDKNDAPSDKKDDDHSGMKNGNPPNQGPDFEVTICW